MPRACRQLPQQPRVQRADAQSILFLQLFQHGQVVPHPRHFENGLQGRESIIRCRLIVRVTCHPVQQCRHHAEGFHDGCFVPLDRVTCCAQIHPRDERVTRPTGLCVPRHKCTALRGDAERYDVYF